MYVLFLIITILCASGVNGVIKKASCDPLFYPEGCASNEVSFRRTSLTANTARQYSVYMHGENSERIQVHAVLVFSHNDTEFHNTLLFNPRQVAKYATLVRESAFRFNNEVVLLSRGRRLLLQYDVAPLNHPYFDYYDYDAALLLDPQSSMWHEYNTITTKQGQLTLSYRSATTHDETAREHGGVYRLQCDPDEKQRCVVSHASTHRFHRQDINATLPQSSLWINGRSYPQYQLVLDPSAQANKLPHELYMRWRYHGERVLSLGWHDATTVDLRLDGRFQYESHQNQLQNTLVLGVDALRQFPRTERRLAQKQFLLYHSSDYGTQDTASDAGGVVLSLVFIVLIVVLMYCLTRWFTSTNYTVLHHLVSNHTPKDRRHFEFQHRQLACELTAVGACVVMWFLTLGITPALTANSFIYGDTVQERKLMLYIFSVFQVLWLLYFLLRSGDSVKAMFYHYWCTVRYMVSVSKGDRDYDRVKYAATHYTLPMKTEVVIMRNLVLHQLLACDMLFIFNYKTQSKTLYMYLFLFVELAILYYYVKYLFLVAYYLYDLTHNHSKKRRRVWPDHATLLMYILTGATAAALFTGFSVPLFYMDFLQQTSSAFSQIQLAAFTLALLAVTCALGAESVHTVIKEAVTDRVIGRHDRRHARRA